VRQQLQIVYGKARLTTFATAKRLVPTIDFSISVKTTAYFTMTVHAAVVVAAATTATRKPVETRTIFKPQKKKREKREKKRKNGKPQNIALL